ncbi:MAG: NUDIX hydrolase [Pseudomonadota bacterium]
MPTRPKLGALAVMIRNDEVLLVKRRNEPDAGLWGFPGGHVELGETALDAASRELREETGVIGTPLTYLTNVDVITHDANNAVMFHFLLAAVLCDYVSGTPIAQDDVSAAGWHAIPDILGGKVPCSQHVDDVVILARKACA